MPLRARRGIRTPRYVTYSVLLLVPLLNLSLLQVGNNAVGSQGQEPPTTEPDAIETTLPTTTPEPTSTTEPCVTTTTDTTTTDTTTTDTTTTDTTTIDTTATDTTAPDTTAPDTTTTEPCPPSSTVGEPPTAIVEALEKITADVVVESATTPDETVETSKSVLETTKDAPTSVKVGKEPGGRVEVTGAGAAMQVRLPTEQGSAPSRVGRNVAVFTAPDRTPRADVAVQSRELGARVMVIIRSPDEPQTYRFPIRIPARGTLVPLAGGTEGRRNTPEERNETGYAIVDRRGDGVGSISAPWAQDSDGNAVDTWYTWESDSKGDSIVQHVAHTGARHPVLADPLLSIGCASFTCAVWFSPSVSRVLAFAAPLGRAVFDAKAASMCVRLHPVAALVCGVLADAFGSALVNALQEARAANACLRVVFTPLVSLKEPSPLRFAADSSAACKRGAETGRRVSGVRPGTQAFVNHRNATFTAVGGALFWIPNLDQLKLLTGDEANPWRLVGRPKLASHMRRYRDVPADGTLLQELSNSAAYYVSAGHCWYVSAEQFERRGFRHEDIRKVPDGGLRQCPHAGDLPPR